MRPGLVAASVVVASVLGGATALAIADATGLTGTETVLVSIPRASQAAIVPAPTTARRGRDFDAAAIYAARAPGVVTIYADLGRFGESQGSGFVVDRQGTILTNAHVITNVGEATRVAGADRLYVEFADGERAPAEIVGWDVFADVGVISVAPSAHRLEPVPLGDSGSVVVGEPVAAIGSPFGNQTSLAVGVVSAIGRSIPSLTSTYRVADAIQTDASINKGNSGGPLLDAGGRAVGVNAQIRSSSGTAEGVGFAIPINIARRSLQQLLATGEVRYAYIGISSQDVTPGIARAFGLAAERGALVATVEPGSPAARAGLRGGSGERSFNGLAVTIGGDVIVSIDGETVSDADDVSRIVTERLLPGERVPFVVLRGDGRRTIPVLLDDRPLPAG